MDNSIRIYPNNSRGPFIRELKSDANNSIVYDGYFYYTKSDLPLQRVLIRFNPEPVDISGVSVRTALTVEHIEIYEHISGDDTSEVYTADNDDDKDSLDGVCFFPTEITTLKYRVIKSDLTSIERKMIMEMIAEKEKVKRERTEDYSGDTEGVVL